MKFKKGDRVSVYGFSPCASRWLWRQRGVVLTPSETMTVKLDSGDTIIAYYQQCRLLKKKPARLELWAPATIYTGCQRVLAFLDPDEARAAFPTTDIRKFREVREKKK